MFIWLVFVWMTLNTTYCIYITIYSRLIEKAACDVLWFIMWLSHHNLFLVLVSVLQRYKTDIRLGKKFGWVEKNSGGRKRKFNIFAFSRKTFAFSRETFHSLTKFWHSIAKIFAFSRKTSWHWRPNSVLINTINTNNILILITLLKILILMKQNNHERNALMHVKLFLPHEPI